MQSIHHHCFDFYVRSWMQKDRQLVELILHYSQLNHKNLEKRMKGLMC